MPAFIGRYLKSPELWFLAVAPDRESAIHAVDAASGEPDVASLRQLRPKPDSAIVLDFEARLWDYDANEADPKAREVRFAPAPAGEDSVFLEDDAIQAWIVKVLRKPPRPRRVEASAHGQRLGIAQPEVMRSYLAGEGGKPSPAPKGRIRPGK